MPLGTGGDSGRSLGALDGFSESLVDDSALSRSKARQRSDDCAEGVCRSSLRLSVERSDEPMLLVDQVS